MSEAERLRKPQIFSIAAKQATSLVRAIATVVREQVQRAVTQLLQRRIEPQDRRIEALERQNAALARRVAELEDHITHPTP